MGSRVKRAKGPDPELLTFMTQCVIIVYDAVRHKRRATHTVL
jgi:hypothetical protein